MKELVTQEGWKANTLDKIDENFASLRQNLDFLLVTKNDWEELFIHIEIYRVKPNNITGRPVTVIDVEEATRLRVEEQWSYQQIAEKLNTSLATIYRRLPKEVIEQTKDLEVMKRAKRKVKRIERERGIG